MPVTLCLWIISYLKLEGRVVCHARCLSRWPALSLQASRYLSGLSCCSVDAIASVVVREGGMRVEKGMGYNRFMCCICNAKPWGEVAERPFLPFHYPPSSLSLIIFLHPDPARGVGSAVSSSMGSGTDEVAVTNNYAIFCVKMWSTGRKNWIFQWFCLKSHWSRPILSVFAVSVIKQRQNIARSWNGILYSPTSL